jgi:small subunit ribosomal protein S16
MLRIRLRRVGKKKQPQYRLVVADSRAPRDGAFIETIGTYNPLTDPATIAIDEDKARTWIGKGAVPSDRAVKILASKGIVDAPVYAPRPKKEKPAEAPAAAAPAAAEAPAAEAPAPEPEAASEEPAASEPAEAPSE